MDTKNITFKELYPTYDNWKDELQNQLNFDNDPWPDAEDYMSKFDLEDHFENETEPDEVARLIIDEMD